MNRGNILAKANLGMNFYFHPPAKAGGNFELNCHRLHPVAMDITTDGFSQMAKN